MNYHFHTPSVLKTVCMVFIITEIFCALSCKKNVTKSDSPVADFEITPDKGSTSTEFTFDASMSTDDNDAVSILQIRWDLENDNNWDTQWSLEKKINHKYTVPGTYEVKLEIKDSDNQTNDKVKNVTVVDNLPPVANFTIEPENGSINTIFSLDASGSYDDEDPASKLQVRWDWEGNNSWDTDWNQNKVIQHSFQEEGVYNVKLEVRDSDGKSDGTQKQVTIEINNPGTPCPGIPTITYEGVVYHTVKIRDQCWLRENLNVGTLINTTLDMNNNGVIEKYCYKNHEDSCTKYGALYQWDEIMNYTNVQGTRGICPEGWHIPTDNEWKMLEGSVDSQYGFGSSIWDDWTYRGSDVGKMLKAENHWSMAGQGINKYGFSVYGHGTRYYASGNISWVGFYASYWTSTRSSNPDYAISRMLQFDEDRIARVFADNIFGFAVRCVKD